MSLRIDVDTGTNEFRTIFFTKAAYDVPLNGVRYFSVLIDASGADFQADFTTGSTIFFYFDGTLELKGQILRIANTSTGIMQLEGIGRVEKKLQQPKAASQAFTATNTTGVMSSDTNNLMGKTGADVSAGTIENQTVNNYRTEISQDVLEAIDKLAQLTDQDWVPDDANDQIDILDHQGAASTTGTLSDGIDISDVSKIDDDIDKVTKVTVLAKGWGANQITGVWGAGGAGAPSHVQGDAEETQIDRSIDNATDAQNLAQNIYNILSATRNDYSFKVLDPFSSFTLGDVVTIDSPRVGANAVNLRITKFSRVTTPTKSELFFQVRGTGERESSEDELQNKSALRRAYRESQAMTQPTDDATAGDGTLATDSHLHADGTYGTDLHLHADGTFSADSSTSNNTAILISEGGDSNTFTIVSGANNNVNSVAISGNYDYLIVEYLLDLNYSLSTDLSFYMEFDGLGTTTGANHIVTNSIGTIGGTLLMPIHASVSGTLTQDVHIISGTLGSVDVTMAVYGWVIDHSHSLPSTGVSGSSDNTSPGVSGDSANTAPGVSGSTADHSH